MSCVKVEVAVLGSPSLISLMVSVDVKHHVCLVCESRGGRPGLPVPNMCNGVCGRKVRARELPLPLPPSPYPLPPFSPSLVSLMVSVVFKHRVFLLCESRCGRPGFPVPNKPDGFCGRKGRPQELPLPLPSSPYPLPPSSRP